jgi:DNA-binding CsgD family transcriptional regulator
VAEQALAAVRTGKTLDPTLGWVVWHVIRAEADAVALTGGVQTSDPSERGALMELGIARIEAGAARDARASALAALCRAELGRYRGADDPAAWTGVADQWRSLGRRYLLAYARYREAEAVLTSRGPRETAANALRSAHAIAVELGAVPLAREIVVLAGHARIDLAPEAAESEGPIDPAAALGLTGRETEVIRLLAAGYSNQQIADALFLSRKTASVHVSNILGKLGVANRVQAAAIAQRLGIVADAPPVPVEDR